MAVAAALVVVLVLLVSSCTTCCSVDDWVCALAVSTEATPQLQPLLGTLACEHHAEPQLRCAQVWRISQPSRSTTRSTRRLCPSATR